MHSIVQDEVLRGQLTDIDSICRFIYAGNARITIVSKVTGIRFTFKVKRKSHVDDFWFVSVLTGTDNEADYQYLGYIYKHPANDELVYRHGGAKAKIGHQAPSAIAWGWLMIQLTHNNPDRLRQLEIWHEGSCGRCGRTLTVPSSIASGFGPECINYV